MYFLDHEQQKTLLDNCLKSRVSEQALTANMLTGPKYCWNTGSSIFIMFFYHSVKDGAEKFLS